MTFTLREAWIGLCVCDSPNKSNIQSKQATFKDIYMLLTMFGRIRCDINCMMISRNSYNSQQLSVYPPLPPLAAHGKGINSVPNLPNLTPVELKDAYC